MDDPHALPTQIHQVLSRGCTVLTANQRAARTLHHAFDLQQRGLGLSHWQPPAIFAWEAWLTDLWRGLLLEGHASDVLLSNAQEHVLWRAIIAGDSAPDGASESLRPMDSLADLAASAWLLLHDYQGRRRLQSSLGNTDTRAFARWVNDFERRCARSQYLTRAQLPEAIGNAVLAHQLPLPSGLFLVGFDSKTPTQTALLEAIESTGISIEELDLKVPGAPSIAVPPQWVGETAPGSAPQPSLTLVVAPDEREELAACARWLRTRLTNQPNSSIAVIVPALENDRAEIDRVFRQILAPELNDITAPSNLAPYEFSLGVALSQTPMAAIALDILRWAINPLPLNRVSALLLSPHFAPNSRKVDTEYLARAEFDAFVLRRQPLLQPEISLDALQHLASNPKHGAGNLPVLLKHLLALQPLFLRSELATIERTHADWAATFHELLEAAGWTTRSHDTSTEFQTRRKWENALDELTTLDFDSRSDGTRVSFATALATLERIATQTLFAPESRHAPVQILGPLESAGSNFDAVWFLRANDLAWPSNPTPNPLLPWPLQRDLAMPGADPARDTAHALRITQRIAASASTVLFSYAQQSTTEGHQRPSPILEGFPLERRHADEVAPPDRTPVPIALEALADDAPIPPPPDSILLGGSSILASQAACPFRAFAEKRLFSSALEPTVLGLDPRERGSLVHDVLDRFWAAVETQAALQLFTLDERDALLNHCIASSLAKRYPNPASGWPYAYLQTEHQRLLNLLRPWLEFEATERPPFTVRSREDELQNVQIGPLHLNIRVDRIDSVNLTQFAEPSADAEQTSSASVGEIILDYKTGPASPNDWLGERPDAPQLPLYAVVSEARHLAAVAFASIRLGKDMGLNGYESHEGILPKAMKLKSESLESQVNEWREVLTSLANDFYSGVADVSPKQYPKTCAYCKQRLLCRLNPAELEADSDAETDDSLIQEDSRG